jgi:hypothetical protein
MADETIINGVATRPWVPLVLPLWLLWADTGALAVRRRFPRIWAAFCWPPATALRRCRLTPRDPASTEEVDAAGRSSPADCPVTASAGELWITTIASWSWRGCFWCSDETRLMRPAEEAAEGEEVVMVVAGLVVGFAAVFAAAPRFLGRHRSQ